MRRVQFEGVEHHFPNDWDDEQVRAALTMYTSGQPVVPRRPAQFTKPILDVQHTRPEVDEGSTDVLGEGGSGLVGLTAQQERFRSRIAQIETGGLDNEWTRTHVKGSSSTAYGTYQITRGLINGYLANKGSMFSEEEANAMRELAERQSIALKIGGSDRPKYEKGGANHVQAKAWAKQFGYQDVNNFLDAFDYAGDYGLADDVDWQFQYENFSRKMMNDHIKSAKGDELEAASVWHGGLNWKKGKHRKQTDTYRKKYEAFNEANE